MKFSLNAKTVYLVFLSLFIVTNVSIAQAGYLVNARFSDGGVQRETLFTGYFDWNGSDVSNFTGSLTQSMYGWDEVSGTYKPGFVGVPPELTLTHYLDGVSSPDADGDVTVSVFLISSTDVFNGGGYTRGDSLKYGTFDGNTPNENAYFTLAFNVNDPTNTLTAMDKIVYGDASPFGLMGPLLTGSLAMTGHSDFGSMGGLPTDLTITAVPVPAAVWLFSTALVGMIGVSRKRVQPA